jgi:hypothetical protein
VVFFKEKVMDKITLSMQLVNQIMAYLGNQPYQGVFQLVDAIQKEAQAQQPEKVQAEPVE